MARGAATLRRALIGVSLLLSVAALPDTEEGEDCSQPGIGCIVRRSNGVDPSWFRPYNWTPNAPLSMAAAVGIGVNSSGHRVPVLQINWTVNMDSSILHLQGAQLSFVKLQTNAQSFFQFQFTNQFPAQRNPEGRPWQFSYSKFEVSPGHQYHVTVQHLPRLKDIPEHTSSNSKSMEVHVPGCADEQMMKTDTCCDLGLCWSPNISLTNTGRNLTVEFNQRYGADRYGIEVRLSALQITDYQYIRAQQRSLAERLNVTFINIGGYEHCLYKISVWPDMASCGNDCIRQYYAPVCVTETPPPPEPPGRWYLWSIAALLTIAASAGLAICCKDYICPSKVNRGGSDKEPIPPPPPGRKIVWLVYSADHPLYIKAVFGLADFLRRAWGLEVVLDRNHVHDIGVQGAMTWLGHQKTIIERSEGTILILCSRGAQEKWMAMQNGQQQRVTLRSDREHPLGDLFTPALTLILPDFQRALSYDRYVVAYFDSISSLTDIPSPLETCPKYALTDHLQELFFRIQRQEQHQPKVHISVCQEDHPSYGHLVRAMEMCRNWQEQHVDWFEKECSLCHSEEPESEQICDEDVDDHCTRIVEPVIRNPQVDISLVEPLLANPDPTMALDPVICDGPPCCQLEPSLLEPTAVVSITQPLLQGETSPNIFLQEPCLVEQDLTLENLIDHLPQQDFYTQSEQDIYSMEALCEAQRRLFFGNVPENPSSGLGFMNVPGHDVTSNLMSLPPEMEEVPQVFLPPVQFVTPEIDPFTSLPDERLPQATDLGYMTMDSGQPDIETLKKEAVRLFLQNGGMIHNNQV